MKKLLWIVSALIILNTSVKAEIYHGIDIDMVYESSDWNSKEDIKKIIDDYTLLLQYQKELDNCPIELSEILECYDRVAKKIIKHFFKV